VALALLKPLLVFIGLRKEKTLPQEKKSRVGYTYKALEEETGYSKRFWRREVALGRIPFVKFDQGVMILQADLDEYLAKRRQVKSATPQKETRTQTQSLSTQD